ncbi:MAG: NHL repeat-containing protein [Candidatus Acidiferrales bacterium]
MRIRVSVAAFILLCGSPFLGGCSQGPSVAMAEKPAVAEPTVQYIGEWGVKGDGPGQLQDPSGIATNSLGDIFIADSGSAFISKFAPEGKPLLSFQEDGLNHPQFIALDQGGAIYVTDPVRNSVFIFLPNGDRYRELRLRTRPVAGNALSVAVGDDGLIHVLDSNARKVFSYTSRLRLVQTWQPSETFPGSRRFGPLVKGPDDYLYLATPSGGIMKLTREGHLIAEITSNTKDVTWNPNAGFAVWSNCVFVMDTNGLMLHIVATDGAPKLDVDLAPQLGQAARKAPPLAVDSHGELLVLDAPEARVLRYRVSF